MDPIFPSTPMLSTSKTSFSTTFVNFNAFMHGLLIVDKPKGFTSNALLQKVKRLLKVKKAGHTGSLDPLASGVLPICLGEATKFSQFLLDSDKHYEVTAQLGVKTDSGDSDGEIIQEREVPEFSYEEIETVLERFRGEGEQIPPMYSALKYQGKPLYRYARAGIEIERAKRKIIIYSLKILNFQKNFLSLSVHASKGTYIRTLVEDIGEMLGCGAHVVALRRTKAGPFSQDHLISIDELEQVIKEELNATNIDYLLPIEAGIDAPEIIISREEALCLQQGKCLLMPMLKPEKWIKVLLPNKKFIGMAEVLEEGIVKPKRLFSSQLINI